LGLPLAGLGALGAAAGGRRRGSRFDFWPPGSSEQIADSRPLPPVLSALQVKSLNKRLKNVSAASSRQPSNPPARAAQLAAYYASRARAV
jgi:hypothetical protein